MIVLVYLGSLDGGGKYVCCYKIGRYENNNTLKFKFNLKFLEGEICLSDNFKIESHGEILFNTDSRRR